MWRAFHLKTQKHTIELHRGDLPKGLDFGASIAVDTETLGLNPARDRQDPALPVAGQEMIP